MSKKLVACLCAVSLSLPFTIALRQSDRLDRRQLRDMLTQLGYEIKDLETSPGKEKYSFTMEKSGLNIPIGAEISPNNAYIWLTVFCKEGVPSGDKAIALLKANSEVQPTQFYVTKSGKIMAGLCIENHGVNNAQLRGRAEKIAEDVGKTKETWQ